MSGLRVIAGLAKGRKLQQVPGMGTRPITDRVKEALFSIMGDSLREANVLDLFAGTGSVGIEALSRGAARATFIENDRQALKIAQANVNAAGFNAQARVLRADVFTYLSNEPREGYDYIHIAPPQYHELWARALRLLDARPHWLNPDGVAVAQIDPKEYAAQTLSHLRLVDERKYGNTLLCFYERPGE
jgi:16S rRNA (guanine(966)-N(2))-methyltransferase RsmD